MNMPTAESFYAALERFERLRDELHPRFDWSSDGRNLRWSMMLGGQRRHFELRGAQVSPCLDTGPTALSPAVGEPTPRTYLRETYLVPDVPTEEALSPDAAWWAFVRDGDIWLRAAGSRSEHRLTLGGTADLTWDIYGGGIDPWSADSRYLFALHFDRTLVPRAVRPRFIGTEVTVDRPRQQKAGAALDIASPHLVPADGSGPMRIDLGSTKDHYFRLLGWLPDATAVVLARYTRTLDRVDIFAIDSRNGQSRLVMSEVSRTFLQSCDIIWSAPIGFTLLPDSRFLWLSERDGWNRLYIGALQGGDLRCLTTGALVIRRLLHADELWAYVLASEDADRPYDVHLYRVSLSGGGQQRLTEGDGVHEIEFSPDHRQFVDTCSTAASPPRCILRSIDGTRPRVISQTDPRRFESARWTPPEEFSVIADDGVTRLHGVLYKPPMFDPAKKYPIVHWVYGGPQLQDVAHTFCPRPEKADAFLHALADSGYLVMNLDARGTPGRSKAFQDVVYREWGDHVVADHAAALRQMIAARPYLDAERVGVAGRSWGGYFALRLLAQTPDLYRAAACVVPGFDPYGGNIYEPYLGLPQTDSAPYEAAEPWRFAQRIKGRVLLIAGTLDSSTLWDAHRMAASLIESGVPHQMLIFPEQEHVFCGTARRFHYNSMREFFDWTLRA